MEQVLSILSKELSKRGISVYKFSRQTGIPKERVYKWMEGKGNPKTDDSPIIKKWLGSDLIEKVPRGTRELHIAKPVNPQKHKHPVKFYDADFLAGTSSIQFYDDNNMMEMAYEMDIP